MKEIDFALALPHLWEGNIQGRDYTHFHCQKKDPNEYHSPTCRSMDGTIGTMSSRQYEVRAAVLR